MEYRTNLDELFYNKTSETLILLSYFKITRSRLTMPQYLLFAGEDWAFCALSLLFRVLEENHHEIINNHLRNP